MTDSQHKLYSVHTQLRSACLLCLAWVICLVPLRAMETIDLGLLENGRSYNFDLSLPVPEDALIVDLQSDCPCLEPRMSGKALQRLPGEPLNFDYKPTTAGQSQIRLTGDMLYNNQVQKVSWEVKAMVIEPSVVARNVPEISPTEIMKDRKKFLCIDIRGADAYEKAHIPQSLEYSISSLSSRKFLQNYVLLIVDNGLLLPETADAIHELREAGIQLYRLAGGLPAWKEAGGSLAGTFVSSIELRSIQLHEWMQLSHQDWQVVDLSGSLSDIMFFCGVQPIRLDLDFRVNSEDVEAIVSTLDKAVSDGDKLLFVGDSSGNDYSGIQSLLADSDLRYRAYYLKSGERAWEHTHASFWNQKGLTHVKAPIGSTGAGTFNMERRISRCSSCPGR